MAFTLVMITTSRSAIPGSAAEPGPDEHTGFIRYAYPL